MIKFIHSFHVKLDSLDLGLLFSPMLGVSHDAHRLEIIVVCFDIFVDLLDILVQLIKLAVHVAVHQFLKHLLFICAIRVCRHRTCFFA